MSAPYDLRPALIYVAIVWIFLGTFKGEDIWSAAFDDVDKPNGFFDSIVWLGENIGAFLLFVIDFLTFNIPGMPVIPRLLFNILVNVPLGLGIFDLVVRLR